MQDFYSYPVLGPFAFEVSLSVIQCLNKLGTNCLLTSESETVSKTAKFLIDIADDKKSSLMFNNLFLFLWRTISDIISTEPSTAREDCHISNSKADELYLESEKLSVKSSFNQEMKFLAGQVTSGHKLSEYYLQLLLYSLVKIIFNCISSTLAAQKSKHLIGKIKDCETCKIDTTNDEGRAVIRHLAGSAVHAIIAELNRYTISFATTTNPVTHKKVSHSIQMRQLLYDNLVIPSSEIHSRTSFPGTLQLTYRFLQSRQSCFHHR